MLIKQPAASNAINKLWNFLGVIEDRLGNCNNGNHDFLTIIYLSTYIASPFVTHRGDRLLDKLGYLIDLSPQRVVCIFRTASPYTFPSKSGKLSLRELQRRAIDFLRDRCYIVVYSKNWEFLNHAKFLLYYHVCFSEGIQYHGKYYGSTNLTNAGLSSRSGRFPGNYEEFVVTGPKPRFLNFTDYDRFYLNEIYELLLHEVRLYTDIGYLRRFFSEHFKRFDLTLQHAQQILSGTTLGELYSACIETQILYNQTFSFLDQLPGKKLTINLITSIEREIRPPEYLLELETRMINDIKPNERTLKDLGLDDKELRELLENAINDLKRVKEKLNNYMDSIDLITDHFDERERKFVQFLEKNSNLHLSYVEKIKMLADKRRMFWR